MNDIADIAEVTINVNDKERPGLTGLVGAQVTRRARLEQFSTDDKRWEAVLERNDDADGVFVYSVSSTRVFCRPTCPARRPARSRVQFHPSAQEAIDKGFRACLRCVPVVARCSGARMPSRERQDHALALACRYIEQHTERQGRAPSLGRVAEAASLSPYYMHRLFRARIGTTPGVYARTWKSVQCSKAS